MRTFSRRGFIGGGLVFSAVALCPRLARAATPTQRKAAVLARALSYERTLPERAGSTVDILIVHAGGSSKGEAQGWASAFGSLGSVKVAGKKLTPHVAAIGAEMAAALDTGKMDVVITCGDPADALIEELSSLSAKNHILSVGTRRAQVEQALTFGVVSENDKLQMLVNLKSAKREGVRFSSKLLKLAEVIR